MEHWFAAVAASVLALVMVAFVVVLSLRVAGPGPAHHFKGGFHGTAVADGS